MKPLEIVVSEGDDADFDNVFHKPLSSKTREWMYFTLFAQTARTENMIISGSLGTIGGTYGTLWTAVYQGATARHVQIAKTRKVGVTPGLCSIDVAGSSFHRYDGTYSISVNHDGIKLNVKGTPSLNWTGKVAVKAGKTDIKWVIPMLRGTFEGTIEIDGTKQDMYGIMFHDQNQIDINIRQMISRFHQWEWGVRHEQDASLLYVAVEIDPSGFSYIAHEQQGDVKAYAYPPPKNTKVDTESLRKMIEGCSTVRTDHTHAVPASSRVHATVNRLARIKKEHAHSTTNSSYLERMTFDPFWRR